MNAAAAVRPLPFGIEALAKSLNDPGVLRVAQALNLNLRDPATRRRLLAETKQFLASTEVSLSQEQVYPEDAAAATAGQSAYVRNALRMYREIAAMKLE